MKANDWLVLARFKADFSSARCFRCEHAGARCCRNAGVLSALLDIYGSFPSSVLLVMMRSAVFMHLPCSKRFAACTLLPLANGHRMHKQIRRYYKHVYICVYNKSVDVDKCLWECGRCLKKRDCYLGASNGDICAHALTNVMNTWQ